jgi:hypothetical protein
MADRYEREIEDILSRIDKFPRRKASHRARGAVLGRIAALQHALTARTAQFSIGKVMLVGMICIVLGYFLRSALGDVWQYVVLAGLALFFGTFLLSLFGAGRGGSRGNYWRGRPVQSYYSSEPDLIERLRNWWRRRQSRR